MNKTLIYIKSILIPILVGLVIGLITSDAMNYNMLKMPPLAPPAILFPIVWTILYTLMGVSYGILKSNNQTNKEIDTSYYTQLAVNALWSIIFFSLKLKLFALLWIILLLVLIIDMTRKFYNKNHLAGLLQIPYIIWVAFATYLNFAVYLLNR